MRKVDNFFYSGATERNEKGNAKRTHRRFVVLA